LWHELLRDSSFFGFLFRIDKDLAAKVRERRCLLCGAALHSGRYPRKLRGAPASFPDDHRWQLSLCCSRDGCRKRHLPPSVRFLGRRVYLGVVVVLVSAMIGGITQKRAEAIREIVGVSIRTLHRWRKWWREIFVVTPFWKANRSRFAKPPEAADMPRSLLESFPHKRLRERVIALLEFLSPITTRARSAMIR
jgi:hypothetical protein